MNQPLSLSKPTGLLKKEPRHILLCKYRQYQRENGRRLSWACSFFGLVIQLWLARESDQIVSYKLLAKISKTGHEGDQQQKKGASLVLVLMLLIGLIGCGEIQREYYTEIVLTLQDTSKSVIIKEWSYLEGKRLWSLIWIEQKMGEYEYTIAYKKYVFARRFQEAQL